MSADEHRWWEKTQPRLNLAERARLAALIDENARLRDERDALWDELIDTRAERNWMRAAALRLRDAWRAERRRLAGARETAAWAAHQEAEREAWEAGQVETAPVPLLTPTASLAERKEWQL